MKNYKLAIIIAVILFIVPFFWLKPGEMNLGGDSGRLYFYDPHSFLKNYTLYNYIASGKGVESMGYVFPSYAIVLFLLKSIFKSPTTLIAVINGFIISTAFLSVYFIARELIGTKEFSFKEKVINYSSILAGFFYIFSQELMYGGWANPLTTHNQFFLNPFMFLLLLRYFLTKKYIYIVFAIIVSFIFAPNFSFVGAPPFFAFYPLTLAFLFCYIKFIKRTAIPYKGFALGILLFLLAHAFHLFTGLSGIFSVGLATDNRFFSQEGASSRLGLDYFIAIASSTKVSLAWMSLTQIENDTWYGIFIAIPLVLIIAFFFNKGKTFLLTGIFFLIALFFDTANITDTGLSFYKLLFGIPGFSMFRNFHGQWVYVFMFFYTILFGQAIAIVANRLSRPLAFFFISSFFIFILLFSIPFLNGDIPIPTDKGTGLRYAFSMDPMYEKVLDFYKTDPIDGKTISFPFTGPGYQILQGLNGGIYQGLPIISYVVGKSDFSGFGSLNPYDNMFLEYMKQKDYNAIKKLLSIMNIKYVFYNSDPFIYSDVFTQYLYAHVSKYAPKSQNEYKSFVENLPVSNRLDFGDKYHIYTVNSDTFLPHIFTTTNVVYTNDQLSFSTDPYFNNTETTAPVSIEDTISKNNDVVLYGSPQTFLSLLIDNSHFHKHDPFISHALSDLFYWYVPIKEKLSLYRVNYRVKDNSNAYFDRSLYYLSKRVNELKEFGKTIPILKKTWEQPKIWEVYRFNAYNSWEASLARYQEGMEELIDWIANSNESIANQEANRIKINEQLFWHQIELVKNIRGMNRKSDEKKYIFSLTNTMFEKLFQKVNIPIYKSSEYYYNLPDYPGEYNVFLGTKDTIANVKDANIFIDSEALKPLRSSFDNTTNSDILQFNNYSLLQQKIDTRFVLNIPPNNLVKNVEWNNSGNVQEVNKLITVTANNAIGENTRGLILDIPDWREKNTYIISFDYLTDGDDFIFSLFNKMETGDLLKKYGYRLFFEKILNSKTWKTHQSIVTENDGANKAVIQISAFTEKDISRIHIKNLSIVKIQYPTMIFKKISSGSRTESKRPRVTFKKINPTKYSVHVEEANSPYGLVFLDSFNNNWKIIDPTLNDKTTMGSLFRFLGFLGKNIVSLFVKDELKSNDIAASYLNGDVKEGIHTNTFLAPSTFETWGKSKVAKDKHSITYDYANIWLIKPEDMQGRSEYTLIIEIGNHKNFYIFGLISVLTFVSLFVYSMKELVLRYEKNN